MTPQQLGNLLEKTGQPRIAKSTVRVKSFSCVLPMPPTSNNLYPSGKNGRRFRSEQYDAWIAAAKLKCGFSVALAKGRYRLIITCHFPDDLRRRDVVSREKACADFLVSRGIIEDDCLIDDNRQLRGAPIRKGEAETVDVVLEVIE